MKNPILTLFLIAGTLYSCSPSSTESTAALQLENNKKLVVTFFEEVINNKKFELLEDLFSLDYIQHSGDMNGKDRQGIKDGSNLKFIRYMLQALPDLHYTVHDVTAEGDIVAINLSGLATHQKEFLGFEASGNKVAYRVMYFYKVVDGKIVEGTGLINMELVKNQLKKE